MSQRKMGLRQQKALRRNQDQSVLIVKIHKLQLQHFHVANLSLRKQSEVTRSLGSTATGNGVTVSFRCRNTEDHAVSPTVTTVGTHQQNTTDETRPIVQKRLDRVQSMNSRDNRVSVNVEYGSVNVNHTNQDDNDSGRGSTPSIVHFSNQSTVYIQHDDRSHVTLVPVRGDSQPEERYLGLYNKDENSNNAKNGSLISVPTRFDSPCSTLTRSFTSSTLQLSVRSSHVRKWRRSESLLTLTFLPLSLACFWRLPYLTLRFGGGSFLLPYAFFVLFLGLPLQHLEIHLGQFSSRSSFQVWGCVQLFKGIGFAQAVVAVSVCVLYCAVSNWSGVYLADGILHHSPWLNPRGNISAQEAYYNEHVLNLHSPMDTSQPFFWAQCANLLLLLPLLCISVSRGVRWLSKSVICCSIVIMCMLVLWLFLGLRRDGAKEGLRFLVTTDWNYLTDLELWWQAAVQAVLSCSVGIGVIICLSSANGFTDKIWKQTLILNTSTIGLSVLCLACVFTHVGGFAKSMDLTHANVTELLQTSSRGLTLLALFDGASADYGDLVPHHSKVLTALCWTTVFLFSFASVLCAGYVVGCLAHDISNRRWAYWAVFPFLTLPSLLAILDNGHLLVILVDDYLISPALLYLLIIQYMGLFCFYGMGRIKRDYKFMQKTYLSNLCKILWKIAYPVCVVGALIVYILDMFVLPAYRPSFWRYPSWTFPLAACFALLPFFLFIATTFVILKLQLAYTFRDRLQYALESDRGWGPKDPQERQEWLSLDTAQSSASEELGTVASDITLATYTDHGTYRGANTPSQSHSPTPSIEESIHM